MVIRLYDDNGYDDDDDDDDKGTRYMQSQVLYYSLKRKSTT